MSRFLFILFFLLPAPALAELSYFKDPVYQTLATEDTHPMSDMIALAKSGDAQAQFILGDLYAKGKGGLEKSPRLAKGWFEKSAFNGYGAGFIRLAALAKREKDLKTALQWYLLAEDHLKGAQRTWARAQKKDILAQKKLDRKDIAAAENFARGWMKDMRRRNAQEPKFQELQPQKPEKKAGAASNLIGPPLLPHLQGAL